MERERLAITRSSFRASTSGTPYTEAISDGLQVPTSKQTVQYHYNTSSRYIPYIIQKMIVWVWSEQRTSEFGCYILIIYSTYFYSTSMWHTGWMSWLHVMTQINNTKQKQSQLHNQLFVVVEVVMEQNFLRAIITTPALIIHPSAGLRCQTGPNTSHAVTT